jgi:hypothetical protein
MLVRGAYVVAPLVRPKRLDELSRFVIFKVPFVSLPHRVHALRQQKRLPSPFAV